MPSGETALVDRYRRKTGPSDGVDTWEQELAKRTRMENLSLLRKNSFLLCAYFGLVSAVCAQPLSILSPHNGARLAAGLDYATEILGDPWDMSNPEDISVDPDDRSGWATFDFHPDGKVGGITTALSNGEIDTAITFLNRGYHKIVNIGRTGQKYPIDTSVFKKISFKMSSGVSGEIPAVYWFHRPPGDILGYGGVFTQASVVGQKIYFADLTGSPIEGQAWVTAPAIGLRIDPNGTQAGHEVFFDWVRLTRADADDLASKLLIAWSGGSGHAAIDVLDESDTVFPISSNAASPINWNYGILPPGNYVLRITSGVESTSVSFQINSPPTLQILDPTDSGGEDFSTVVLNNVWDMNSAQDANLVNAKDISFSNGVLNATNTTNDPIVVLHNSEVAIDTLRYRYLSYRLKLDGRYDIANGSMTRVFWSSSTNANAPSMTNTKDIIAWPGKSPGVSDFVTYTIDLGQLTVENGGIEATGAQQEWGSAGEVRYLRIDPHEFTSEKPFHFDYVTLAAMREAKGIFPIKYVAFDSNIEDASAKVSLYYALDKMLSSRRLIAQNLPLSSSGSYAWELTEIPVGNYYIYAEVDDGLNKYGAYSSGLLRVLPTTFPSAPIITSAVAGKGRIIINFVAPQDNGGMPIINYTATCTAPGYPTQSIVGSSSPIVVAYLIGGIAYSCTVKASNSIGMGSPSSTYVITPLPARKTILNTIFSLLE